MKNENKESIGSKDAAAGEEMKTGKQDKGSRKSKFLTILGTVICVLLLPVLIVNCTLLVKSYRNQNQVPSFGGYLPMIILSDSMLPDMKSGDLILCRSAEPSEIRIGDVISFYDPDGNGTAVVTHRVTEIMERDGELFFRTKGDNNNTEDRSLVPGSSLAGRYTGLRIGGLGSIAMFLQTTAGFVICILVPLFLFFGYDFLRRKKSDRKQKEESDALRAEVERLRAQL